MRFHQLYFCSTQTSMPCLPCLLMRSWAAPFTPFPDSSFRISFLTSYLYSSACCFTAHGAQNCKSHRGSRALFQFCSRNILPPLIRTSAHKGYCLSLLWRYQCKHLTLWVCMCTYNYHSQSHFCVVSMGPSVQPAIFWHPLPLTVRLTPAWAISPGTDGTAPTHIYCPALL